MKTLGIVGGLGPESTIDYYRLILAGYHERAGHYPPLLIHSLDIGRGLVLVAEDHAALADYLSESVATLARGGADFALMAANTPHVVFDEVERRAPIPLLSIVVATRDAATAAGLKRLLLLGTRFTMRGGFYERAFAERGMEVVVPGDEDVAYIHDKYISELIPGTFLDATRDEFVRRITRMCAVQKVDAVIFAGTELPLLLRGVELPVPALDTTGIHVAAAVARLLAGE